MVGPTRRDTYVMVRFFSTSPSVEAPNITYPDTATVPYSPAHSAMALRVTLSMLLQRLSFSDACCGLASGERGGWDVKGGLQVAGKGLGSAGLRRAGARRPDPGSGAEE